MIIPSLIQIQVSNMSLGDAKTVKMILDDVLSDCQPDIQAHETTMTVGDRHTTFKQVPDGRGLVHGLYHATIVLDDMRVAQSYRGDYQEAYREEMSTRSKALLELLIEAHDIHPGIDVKLVATPPVSRCEAFASRTCCHLS